MNLGQYNVVDVVSETKEGLVLYAGEYGEVFLKRNEVPSTYNGDNSIKVFLYYDSRGVVTATTTTPLGVVGQFSCLKVVDVLDIGAFLDWGLPKDIFAPVGEQEEMMQVDEYYVVYLYHDKERSRLAASSRLEKYLDQVPAKYKYNDEVDLLVCYKSDLGYSAIVNHAHWGLLYQNEVFQELEFGQVVKGYVKKVREDGKVDLSLQPLGYQKLYGLEVEIMIKLESMGGELAVTDKSDSEVIQELFGVSKKKFKVALGALYKAKRILIEQDVIKKV